MISHTHTHPRCAHTQTHTHPRVLSLCKPVICNRHSARNSARVLRWQWCFWLFIPWPLWEYMIDGWGLDPHFQPSHYWWLLWHRVRWEDLEGLVNRWGRGDLHSPLVDGGIGKVRPKFEVYLLFLLTCVGDSAAWGLGTVLVFLLLGYSEQFLFFWVQFLHL